MPPVVPDVPWAGLVRAEWRTRCHRAWAKMMARRKGRADMANNLASARALFRGDLLSPDPATPCFTIWIDALHSRARQKGHKVPSPSSHPLTSVGVSSLRRLKFRAKRTRKLCGEVAMVSTKKRHKRWWSCCKAVEKKSRGKSRRMNKPGSEQISSRANKTVCWRIRSEEAGQRKRLMRA